MRKFVTIVLPLVALALSLSGCSGMIIVGPEVTGDVRICTYDSYIYGYVYIDGLNTGYSIDGWGGPSCTGWIRVTLDTRHTVEVWSSLDGTTYSGSFRPTYSGQTITLP